MQKEIVARMNNLADSGQDDFIGDYTELAKQLLYEMGISNKYLNSDNASYIISKVVTDLLEDGNLSITANAFIATLRINHPRSEDNSNV